MNARAAWLENAACRGADVSLFFPERGENPHEARRICKSCPVNAECLQFSIQCRAGGRVVDGVWAGYSYKQRRRLRAQTVTQRTP